MSRTRSGLAVAAMHIAADVAPLISGDARRCGSCSFHRMPSWPTGGFGTCEHAALSKMLRVVGGGYLATSEHFGCGSWSAKGADA